MNTRKKSFLSTMLLLLLLLLITIGYAYLSTTLSINGSSKINNASWDIHFENVQVTTGSVTASTPVINPNTTVTYNVHLSKPGDFYEFTVDAKNSGSIDAMIDTIISTLNNTEIQSLPTYLNYSVTYSDGMPITSKQELKAGTKETIKIKVEYKKDISTSDLPSTDQNLSLSFTITYTQKDNTSTSSIHPESFSTDSWETITNAVKVGNTNPYEVGDTKSVDMGTLGIHTLRISNKSTPAECYQEGFSQTACGFVLEFEGVITRYQMNSNNTNSGGWEQCEMRTFLNDENAASSIINLLPETLKNSIINTQVYSGLRNNASNHITTDKLYLLATHEIMEDVDGNPNSGLNGGDNSYNYTRQLDYYKSLNVTTSNYSAAIKTKSNSPSLYWLRSAHSPSNNTFWTIHDDGFWGHTYARNTLYISPAFRIG